MEKNPNAKKHALPSHAKMKKGLYGKFDKDGSGDLDPLELKSFFIKILKDSRDEKKKKEGKI